MNAKEIIIKEGWLDGMIAGTLKPEDIVESLTSKYADQRVEIMIELIKASTSNPISARKEMLVQIDTAIKALEGHNRAFEVLGISPLVNDTKKYDDENSDAMIAEDMVMGLRLFNACAAYVRMYNAAKLE